MVIEVVHLLVFKYCINISKYYIVIYSLCRCDDAWSAMETCQWEGSAGGILPRSGVGPIRRSIAANLV